MHRIGGIRAREGLPVRVSYRYQKGTYSERIKRRVEERCRMTQVLLGAGEWLAKEQEVQELEPFVGIGPRRYLDLFSLKLGGGSPLERKSGRMAAAWSREAARPRVPLQPMSYIDREKTAAKHVEEFLRKRSQQGGKPQ